MYTHVDPGSSSSFNNVVAHPSPAPQKKNIKMHIQDLPWRYKLILPPIATMPLLCSYSGSTSVIIPKPLRSWLWRAAYPRSVLYVRACVHDR